VSLRSVLSFSLSSFRLWICAKIASAVFQRPRCERGRREGRGGRRRSGACARTNAVVDVRFVARRVVNGRRRLSARRARLRRRRSARHPRASTRFAEMRLEARGARRRRAARRGRPRRGGGGSESRRTLRVEIFVGDRAGQHARAARGDASARAAARANDGARRTARARRGARRQDGAARARGRDTRHGGPRFAGRARVHLCSSRAAVARARGVQVRAMECHARRGFLVSARRWRNEGLPGPVAKSPGPTQPHDNAILNAGVRFKQSRKSAWPQFFGTLRTRTESLQRRRRESSNWEGRRGTGDDSRRANLHPFRVDTIESASPSDTLHARGSRIEARGASSRERASLSRDVRAAYRASRRGFARRFFISFSERRAAPSPGLRDAPRECRT